MEHRDQLFNRAGLSGCFARWKILLAFARNSFDCTKAEFFVGVFEEFNAEASVLRLRRFFIKKVEILERGKSQEEISQTSFDSDGVEKTDVFHQATNGSDGFDDHFCGPVVALEPKFVDELVSFTTAENHVESTDGLAIDEEVGSEAVVVFAGHDADFGDEGARRLLDKLSCAVDDTRVTWGHIF